MQEESREKSKDAPFESLRILSERWKNGTFSEIIDDWKWIFGYSARYKGAIVFYTILGILSTSLGLVKSLSLSVKNTRISISEDGAFWRC